ncbi:MAG: glycosyl hydrolase family protein [Chloroflexi bacterium]|nr:MAG: glycosyl hydrolase family protein [Chloroflexota bacterium]
MKTNIKNILTGVFTNMSQHKLIWAIGALIITLTFGAAISTVVYKNAQISQTPKQPPSIYDDALKSNGTPRATDPESSADESTSLDTSKQNTADTKQQTGGQQSAQTQNKPSTSSSPSTKPPTSGSGSTTPIPPKPTAPVVTPPTPTLPPSGQAVPRSDFGVWKHIFYDDFTKDATLGTWGEDWNGDKIVYTGAQGQQWRAYPKSYKDTYNQRPYRSDQVLSVKNSMLNFWLHNVEGQPAGANPSPIISSGSQYQTYGRYSARFKVDSPNLREYYVAWLLWPQSERWPQDGEMDFPEGNLSGNVGGFHHYSGAGSCTNGCQDVANVPANTKFTDWHTYTIEWMPGRVRYILDDKVVLDSTKWVPSGPMRWQLQTETNGNGTNSGNLTVDWVSVWSYRP